MSDWQDDLLAAIRTDWATDISIEIESEFRNGDVAHAEQQLGDHSAAVEQLDRINYEVLQNGFALLQVPFTFII